MEEKADWIPRGGPEGPICKSNLRKKKKQNTKKVPWEFIMNALLLV